MTLLFLLLGLAGLWAGTRLTVNGFLDRLNGAALLIAYLIFSVALVQAEHIKKAPPGDSETRGLQTLLGVTLTTGLVTLSARAVVTSGVWLAASWGVSETLVGVLRDVPRARHR